MRKVLPLLSLVFLTACSAKSGISVSQMLVAGTVNVRSEIESVQTSFTDTQPIIYVHAFVTGLTEETLVRGEWWYDGGKEPRKIYESNVTISDALPVAKFTLQSTQKWPKGAYRFLLFADDTQIGETKFDVVSGS